MYLLLVHINDVSKSNGTMSNDNRVYYDSDRKENTQHERYTTAEANRRHEQYNHQTFRVDRFTAHATTI